MLAKPLCKGSATATGHCRESDSCVGGCCFLDVRLPTVWLLNLHPVTISQNVTSILRVPGHTTLGLFLPSLRSMNDHVTSDDHRRSAFPFYQWTSRSVDRRLIEPMAPCPGRELRLGGTRLRRPPKNSGRAPWLLPSPTIAMLVPNLDAAAAMFPGEASYFLSQVHIQHTTLFSHHDSCMWEMMQRIISQLRPYAPCEHTSDIQVNSFPIRSATYRLTVS